MRLSSQGSQFIFNLPSDFLKPEVIETYTPILEKNWVQYENVIDYFAFNDERIYLNRFDSIRLPMPNEKEIIFKEKENYIVQPKLLGTQLYQCIYW